MNRWVKRMLWTVLSLLLLGAVAFVGASYWGERKRERVVSVAVKPVAWAIDTAGLERGRYLYQSRGCADCHGTDGGGKEFINDGKGMRIRGPNITLGGPVTAYDPENWVRLIRHGVKKNGRPVFIMPSEDYARFTDQDVAALVGYVRNLPIRIGGPTVVELPRLVKALYGLGAIQDAFEKIDHTLPPAQPIPAAVSPAHGAYVANMCIGCHGPSLAGGKIPGGPPDWPAAANITPGKQSAMPRYPDAASFVRMLRSGKRPDGTEIRVMPFASLGELNDVDAQALYAYLGTVPARAAGER